MSTYGGQKYTTINIDECNNIPCNAEPPTLEEDVVDDWLTLDGSGDRLLLGENISLYDTECHSKQEIRELEADIRGELEAMAYEVSNRLREAMHAEKTKAGWVVVDTTWSRGPLSFKDGWLGTAHSVANVATVFDTQDEANAAIEKTRTFKGSIFAWSDNNYVALEVR
jgi:hypothetical protein